MTLVPPEQDNNADWQRYHDKSFISHIGPVLERWTREGRELALPTHSMHQNLSGMVHGGVIMSMLDRIMGEGVRDLRPGERFATASMTIDFLRGIMVGEVIHFRSHALKVGRKAINTRGEAWVGDKLCASTSAIFMAVG